MLRASADRVEREGNSTYRSSGPKIHVVTVKPVPSSNYCAWRDPKFYVLSWVNLKIRLRPNVNCWPDGGIGSLFRHGSLSVARYDFHSAETRSRDDNCRSMQFSSQPAFPFLRRARANNDVNSAAAFRDGDWPESNGRKMLFVRILKRGKHLSYLTAQLGQLHSGTRCYGGTYETRSPCFSGKRGYLHVTSVSFLVFQLEYQAWYRCDIEERPGVDLPWIDVNPRRR